MNLVLPGYTTPTSCSTDKQSKIRMVRESNGPKEECYYVLSWVLVVNSSSVKHKVAVEKGVTLDNIVQLVCLGQKGHY